MAQTLTTDLQQIDGAQAADINSAQTQFRRYQLPQIVDAAPTGTQIADLTLLVFTNNGEGVCELFEFGTGRVAVRVMPFEKLIMRGVLDNDNGEAGWQLVNQRETIIAAADETHLANQTTPAVTSVASASAISNTDTYSDASYNTGFNGAVDTAIGAALSTEVDFDASVASLETKINAAIDRLEGQNISAAA